MYGHIRVINTVQTQSMLPGGDPGEHHWENITNNVLRSLSGNSSGWYRMRSGPAFAATMHKQ